MKAKKTNQQNTDELLQKLQQAVLSAQEPSGRKQKPDADEVDFQNKIAGMLNRVSGEESRQPPAANDGDTPAPPEKPAGKAGKQTPDRTERQKAGKKASPEPEPAGRTSPASPRKAEPDAAPEEQPKMKKRSGQKTAHSAAPAPIRALTAQEELPAEDGISGEQKLPEALLKLTADSVPTAAKVDPEDSKAAAKETKPAAETAKAASNAGKTASAATEPPEKPAQPAAKPPQPEGKPKVRQSQPEAKQPQPAVKPAQPEEKPKVRQSQPEAKQPQPTVKPAQPEEKPKVKPSQPEAKQPQPAAKPAQPEEKPKVRLTQPEATQQQPAVKPTQPAEAIVIPPVQPAAQPQAPIVIKPRQTDRPDAPKRLDPPAAPAAAAPQKAGRPGQQVPPSPSPQAEQPRPAAGQATSPERPQASAAKAAPAPEANKPAPKANKPAPETTKSAPQANQSAPQANQSAPQAAKPAPEAAAPAPQARRAADAPKTAPAAAASGPAPQARTSAPGAGNTTTRAPGKTPPKPPRPGLRPAGPRMHPAKKRPMRINRTPIAALPEDDNLDEALDEIVPEESPMEVLPMEEPEVVQTRKQSVFAVMKEKKQKRAEEAMNAIALIEKKTNLTEDDVALIFELGYENELGRLVGYDALRRLKFDHIRRTQAEADSGQYRTAFGYRNPAFTGGAPRRELMLEHYAHDRRRLMLRLLFTALCTLLLIPIDLPGLFGGALAPYTEAAPLLFPALGLLLLCAAGLFSLRQITAGLRSLFRFTPTPYSAAGLFVPLSLLTGALSLLVSGDGALPLNLSASGLLLVCAVCDALRLSDEMRVCRIAAADGEKTVLETAEPRKKKLRAGDRIVKIINDDVDEALYRVRRTAQLAGFFRRCNDFSDASRPFTAFIASAVALAVLGGIGGGILSDSFSGALQAFSLFLMFTLPTSSLLLYFYPLCRANAILSRRNCALIGEESVEEYSRPKTVIFNDSDMYTAQRCTQISVREGEDFRQDMRLAGVLFRKMSGTLGAVGQNAPLHSSDDPPVAFVRLTENGTEAVVDNRYHLLAGNAAFLAKSGVRVPRETTDRTGQRAKNVSLMYVAIDGVLRLSYEIEYTVASSFEEMALLLAESDTTTAIQTYDPNLNEAFLRSSRPDDAGYVRVIKPGRYEPDALQEVADSGAVALGKVYDIALPLAAAVEIRRVRTAGVRLQLAGIAAGALAALLLFLNRSLFLPAMLVLFPMLFRGLWLAISFFLTRFGLRPDE